MQYVVLGLDGLDSEAPDRRAKARPAHIAMGDRLLREGKLWFGAALLHDDGSMKGSTYIVNFASEEELQSWLNEEPYVLGDVWQDLTIHKSNTRDPWQFSHSQQWFENN